MIWLGVCLLLLVATAALAVAYFLRAEPKVNPVRLALTPAEKTTLAGGVTVSPDGLRVAFISAGADGRRQVWLRSLDTEKPELLGGTEDAIGLFWSPDSRSIAYFANGKLFRVEAAHGRPQQLCEVREGSGGTWNRDGVILFGGPEGLQRVSAQGGTPVLATKLDAKEEAHRWPSFLPDGRHFVFLADAQTTENHHIRLGSLDSQESQILFGAVSRIAYAPPGYLLYVNQGALVAHPFDARSLKVTGDPFTVAEHIAEIGVNHYFDFSISDNGVLAYQIGSEKSQLVWYDRYGKRLEPLGDVDSYASISLSVDGQHVAAGLLDPDGRQSDVWLFDLSRSDARTRLTFDPQSDGDPVWSADGKRLAFSSNRSGDGHIHLYDTSASGTGGDQLLLNGDGDDIPTNWSRDGKNLLFMRFQSDRPSSIWVFSFDDRQAKPLLQSQSFEQGAPAFSPNGRFIAYDSTESGHLEVYVQTFPLSDKKWVISSGGGLNPRWRDDGKELFYLTQDGKVMSAQLKDDFSLDNVVTKQLFKVDIKMVSGFPFDASPDGSRFLINTPAEVNNPAPLVVVLNWPAIQKQKQ